MPVVTVEEKEQEEEGLIVEKEEVPVVAVEEEEQEEVRELIKSKLQQLKAFSRAVGKQGKSGLNKLATSRIHNREEEDTKTTAKSGPIATSSGKLATGPGFTARTVRYAFNFYHLISNLILSFF